MASDGKTPMLPYKGAIGPWAIRVYDSFLQWYSIYATFTGTDKSTQTLEIVIDTNWWGGTANQNLILAELNRRRGLLSAAVSAAKTQFLAYCNAFISDSSSYATTSAKGADQQTAITTAQTNINSMNITVIGLQTQLTAADAALLALQQQIVTATAARDSLNNQINSISAQVSQQSSSLASMQANEVTPAYLASLQANVTIDTNNLNTAAGTLNTLLPSESVAIKKALTDCLASASSTAIATDLTAIS